MGRFNLLDGCIDQASDIIPHATGNFSIPGESPRIASRFVKRRCANQKYFGEMMIEDGESVRRSAGTLFRAEPSAPSTAVVSNGKIASERNASNDSQGYRYQGWCHEENGNCDRLEVGNTQTDGQGEYHLHLQLSFCHILTQGRSSKLRGARNT
jgi:hypothetical protein